MLDSLLNRWDALVIEMSTTKQDILEKYHSAHGFKPEDKSFKHYICKGQLNESTVNKYLTPLFDADK